MEFRLSREQELFKKAVREHCEKNIAPRSREIDQKEAGIPDDIIKGLAKLGVFGCVIPKEYGGSSKRGEETQYSNIAIQEIARSELSMSVPVYTLLTVGWGGQFLRLFAKDEVKKEVLPKLAAGEWFWGINMTEPQGGSDVAAIKTTAIRKGNKFVVNGEKAFISGVTESAQRGGGHSSLFYTDPAKGTKGGMTMLATHAKLPGISSTVYKDMGRMGLSTGGFVYKNVEIPEKYILGEEGRGFYHCMEGLNIARAVVAAACVGGAEKCLEIGSDWVKQRTAFGRPIGKFDSISFEMADDYTKLEMLKLLLQKGCWMIDEFYKDKTSFTYKDINVTIAQCKWLAPLVGLDIAKHAMMWLGAASYTKDYPLEMAMRGIMSYVVGAEGATNIMKMIVVRDVFGAELLSTR